MSSSPPLYFPLASYCRRRPVRIIIPSIAEPRYLFPGGAARLCVRPHIGVLQSPPYGRGGFSSQRRKNFPLLFSAFSWLLSPLPSSPLDVPHSVVVGRLFEALVLSHLTRVATLFRGRFSFHTEIPTAIQRDFSLLLDSFLTGPSYLCLFISLARSSLELSRPLSEFAFPLPQRFYPDSPRTPLPEDAPIEEDPISTLNSK